MSSVYAETMPRFDMTDKDGIIFDPIAPKAGEKLTAKCTLVGLTSNDKRHVSQVVLSVRGKCFVNLRSGRMDSGTVQRWKELHIGCGHRRSSIQSACSSPTSHSYDGDIGLVSDLRSVGSRRHWQLDL